MYKKQNSSNSSEGDDNTSLSPSPPKKQVSPAVHWSFVLNNWTEDEYSNIVESDSSEVPVLVVNKEIGEEEGTPHLQGCLSFNSKKRPMSLGWSRRIHWYGVRTTSVHRTLKLALQGAREYASKKHTRVLGTQPYCRGWQPPYEYNLTLRPWQQTVVDSLKEEADDRTIHWLWESHGGVGKTALQKWIIVNMKQSGVIILSGNKHDMKYGICSYRSNHDGQVPNIVLINIPRADKNRISYSGIEEIKDMCFFSGKYEGEMVVGQNPHVWVFANFEPIVENFSKDRWKVHSLAEG